MQSALQDTAAVHRLDIKLLHAHSSQGEPSRLRQDAPVQLKQNYGEVCSTGRSCPATQLPLPIHHLPVSNVSKQHDCKLISGLVLLNSAGNVNRSYTPPTEDPSQAPTVPPKLLVDAASQGLFLFLRTSVARTLTRLYPVAPGNADEWLGQEILRAAADPGALGVFRSSSSPMTVSDYQQSQLVCRPARCECICGRGLAQHVQYRVNAVYSD